MYPVLLDFLGYIGVFIVYLLMYYNWWLHFKLVKQQKEKYKNIFQNIFKNNK